MSYGFLREICETVAFTFVIEGLKIVLWEEVAEYQARMISRVPIAANYAEFWKTSS